MNNSILKIENISRSFKTGNRTLEILKGISLDITAGEILAIVGPSGAGKSTLLHLMGLLDKPTSGRVLFKDKDIYALPGSEQARLRNSSFAFIFQFYHLIPELNIMENILGLTERVSHKPNQLSGGEQQRVAIARALVTDPEIILCDEPTGNLDTNATLEIQNLISELNRQEGKTFVIVTHNDNIARWSHRMIHLVDGQIANPKE